MGVVRRLKGVIVIEKANTKISKKLKRLREDSGKTQKELADAFGVSVSSIGMYEIGLRIPTDKVKKQYAIFFNKKVDDIFF